MSSPLGNLPSEDPIVEGRNNFTTGWQTFLSSVARILTAQTSSGTTAQRPTVGLFTGRQYFDTTLGLLIFYKTAGWVKADGSAA